IRLDERMNHVVEFVAEYRESRIPQRVARLETMVKVVTGLVFGGGGVAAVVSKILGVF
ncbi:hypothetical protein LCGC14_2043610, partial [marine sediment metagenome]